MGVGEELYQAAIAALSGVIAILWFALREARRGEVESHKCRARENKALRDDAIRALHDSAEENRRLRARIVALEDREADA